MKTDKCCAQVSIIGCRLVKQNVIKKSIIFSVFCVDKDLDIQSVYMLKRF